MRRFPTALLSATVALTAPLALLGSPGAQAFPTASDAPRSAPSAAGPAGAPRAPGVVPGTPDPDPDDPHTWQTSDQVPGEIARPIPRWQRGDVERHRRYRFHVRPGVIASSWDERNARGPVRWYLLQAFWRQDGVRLDYARSRYVKRTQPLSRILRRTPRAVAGINGDFFDIGDTGAPLGLGRERATGLRHGIDYGWNSAFYFGKRGRPYIDVLNMRAAVEDHPGLVITNVNSPQVKPGGIGIYTRQWGYASGYRWTDGQRKDVWMVHIVDGRVVESRGHRLDYGEPVRGQYLVARGPRAARQLRAALEMSERVRTRWWLPRTPPMAITGNKILLEDGKVMTSDDGEMHPRTAVGIDRDNHRILFLVVDGRQEHSRGYTMLELARKLKKLGAEDGLNLDGGGSSTFIAERGGRMRVLNRPSDGAQRYVPNGLEVIYAPGREDRRKKKR